MNNLAVTEFKDIRVLTTQQLAESYETNVDTITKNFNRNKDRYEEGKHFICLEGDQLKEFKANGQIDLLPNINKLYLWTEKGSFLHAKSLNTDKAWEVYDILVDTYFKKQNLLEELSPELQAIFSHDKKLQFIVTHINQQDQKIINVDNDLQAFKKDMPLLGVELDRIKHARNKKIVPLLGGKGSQAYNDKSLRTRVYEDSAGQIWREFGVRSFKEIKRSQIDLVIEVINGYKLPMALEEEIKDANAQLVM